MSAAGVTKAARITVYLGEEKLQKLYEKSRITQHTPSWLLRQLVGHYLENLTDSMVFKPK